MGFRVTRTATASWQGEEPSGGGRIGVGSGAFEGPFTLRARTEDVERSTNPEELIGAADAGCVTRTELGTTGEVPGVDADTFAKLAQQAKDTCPVSRALAGTEIILEARIAGD